VGKVQEVNKKGVVVDVIGAIKRGDGVVFDRGNPEEKVLHKYTY
jgi:hypothetical protein